MRFEGIHHVTAITGDAPGNVDFYTRLLGLRMVKKTVNQDDPTVYHLFYADERGSAGSDITFFEYPGAARGRAGAGMVHTVVFRVASADSLAFWHERLTADGLAAGLEADRVTFADREGLRLELELDTSGDEPLVAENPEIPREHAIRGFAGVRAFAADVDHGRDFLEQTLGFEPDGEARWRIRGEHRGSSYVRDAAPAERGVSGAGTVHHVAWSSPMEEHEAWQQRVAEAGMRPTPVIDRFYFRSVYFRERGGVLFEIATLGPGFATDEPLEELGRHLSLPPAFEHLRGKLEGVLTPLPEPPRHPVSCAGSAAACA
jgi:glyoxalase family protein